VEGERAPSSRALKKGPCERGYFIKKVKIQDLTPNFILLEGIDGRLHGVMADLRVEPLRYALRGRHPII